MEIIFTKNSRKMAEKVADNLNIVAYPSIIKRFNDDEMIISVPKTFFEVTVIASTLCNDDWFELFLLLDALKDARKINLCLTYMGYSRQDKVNPNESNGYLLFAKFLENFNISKFIFLDNHSEPTTSFPFAHLSALPLFINDIRRKHAPEKIAIVSPDLGKAKNAQLVADSLGCSLAFCVKNRDIFGKINKSTAFGDVKNKVCILIDDMIDTGNTVCYATNALFESGASKVIVYVTHGILSQGAVNRLEASEISEIFLTDSISNDSQLPSKFKKLTVASLITEAIRCIL